MLSSYVGPITTSSECTAEPRDTLPPDSTYNLGRPYDNYTPGGAVPAIDEVVPNLQAGARTDYCIGYALTPDMNVVQRDGYAATPDERRSTHLRWGDDQKNVVVETPVGFAAAITAASICSEGRANPADTTSAGFGYNDPRDPVCAADSKVGDAMVRVTTAQPPAFYDGVAFHLLLPQQQIVRLPAADDEVARLGVSIKVPFVGITKFLIRVKFAAGDPMRLVSIVDPAPRDLVNTGGSRFAIYVESVALRLFGAKNDHPTMLGNFAESGTQCGVDLSSKIALTTYGEYGTIFGNPPYQGETPTQPAFTDPSLYRAPRAPITLNEQTSNYQLSGCENLDFRPSVDVATTEKRPAVPTGVTVKLGLGQSDPSAPTGTALLKDAAVTLPAGLELGAQVGSRAGGLRLCSPAEFDRTAPTPAGCSAGSKVGTVRIDSPLVGEPLAGSVYLGPQQAIGELPDLYLEASLGGRTGVDAPRIKLIGTTNVSADGQITSTFKNNPELRFSQLELTFDGGDNALFVTPRTCGAYTSTSTLTSWAAPSTPVSVNTSLTIDQACDLPGFAPSVAVQPANTTAGVKAPVSVVVSRPDRSAWLQDVHVSLPSGQLADLRGLPECPRWAADAGNCPENTRIGTVTSVAGVGPNPLSLTGGLYFVEREGGAVAGAVIVVRAKIGELDLGDVVVPGRINLRPTDAGLDFITSAPTRFRGLALNLQSITVALDRPDFALNPSACGPIGYSAQITGSGGESVGTGGSVSYQGCGDLPFAPRLDARLTGEVEPGGHPGMNVTVVTRPGDSTMRKAEVILPEGVAADLKNVQVSCSRADFDAVRCPANTKVGTVAARVSITDEVIPGEVILVKVPGETLPGLGLNFTGRFAQRLMSIVKINATGRLITRFDSIPDLPLTAFNIDVKSGADGPLQLPPGECAANTRWDGTFGAWGGQTATSQIGLRCAAPAKVKLSKGSGLSTRMFDFGGRHLRTLKVTLPSGVTFNTKRAKSKKYQWVRLASSKAKLRFTKRSVTITATEKDATNLRLKVKPGALKFSKRAAKKKSQTLKLRMVFQGTQAALNFTPGEKNPILIDGAVQTQTLTYKQPSKKSKAKSKKSGR